MSGHHDPASGSLASWSGMDVGAEGTDGLRAPSAGDPLADVLQSVKLTGALFFLVDATSPWCVDIPAADCFADIILPRAQHIVSYHVVVEGSGLASVPGLDPVAFEAGDIIVFPQADPYIMRSAPDVPPELDADETIEFFRAMASGALPFVVQEGGGAMPPARFICGFLGCDARPFNPLLATLPRLLHVRRGSSREHDLLDPLIDLAMIETRAARAGGECIRLRLSELMFIEVVRHYIENLSLGETGWLAGLGDPVVGRALALLHAKPAIRWTLETLAAEAGLSRSALAERFTNCVGEPPMQYLTRWRMQIAARLLSDGTNKIAAIAAAAGYASEAAFSRSFKKLAGMPPGAWRRRFRSRS